MRFVGQQLAELYRRGFALFLLAPLIVALVVIPEFLQHIVEIRLGMFESVERFRALGSDPTRWAFGYVKLAGLALSMVAAARFWGVRETGGIWWNLRDVAWIPLCIGTALFIFVPAVSDPFVGRIPEWLHQIILWGLSIAVLPLLFVVLAALFGDRSTRFVEGYRRGWRWLPLLALLLVVAYGPALALHLGLHRLAAGLATPIVWALMTVDALVVGLLASLAGAALSLAYRAWRPGRPLSRQAPSVPPSQPQDRAPEAP
jgi:hypothetical protein